MRYYHGTAIIAIAALTVQLLLAGVPVSAETTTTKEGSEELTLDYKKHGRSVPLTTAVAYDGDVTISVRGSGQASGTSQSDAFYIFSDYDGNAVTSFTAGEFGLYINDAVATGVIGTAPAYAADHSYTFTVKATGSKLSFSLGEYGVGDNAGTMYLTVKGPQVQTTLPDLAFSNRHSGSFKTYENDFGDLIAYVEIADKNKTVTSDTFKSTFKEILVEIPELNASKRVSLTAFSSSNSEAAYNVFVSGLGVKKDGKSYTLKITIDPDNTIAESDESNNELIKTISFETQTTETQTTASTAVTNYHQQSLPSLPSGYNEWVIVDASKHTTKAPVNTENRYSGIVEVQVEGIIQASGTSLSDAYYVLTDYSGKTVTPIKANEFGIYVNGRRVQDFYPQSYRNGNQYYFKLALGDMPKAISFAIGDLYTSDNAGAFRIAVKGRSDISSQIKLPDLVVKNIYAADLNKTSFPKDVRNGEPRLPKVGEDFLVAVYMGNVGTLSTDQGFYLKGYYNNVLFDEVFIDTIVRPQETFTAYFQNKTKPFRLNSNAEGSNTIEVYIDSKNHITESDENNNSLTKKIVISDNSVSPENSDRSETYNNKLILKLERTISQLEQKVVDLEKKLVQRIDRVLSQRMAGRILLQVEENGEAWYVDPASENKLYLKDGLAAYDIMRGLGLGISNANLEKIPVGVQDKLYDLTDTDADGLPDKLEEAIGTNPNNKDSDSDGFDDKAEVLAMYKPNGKDRYPIDTAFANKFRGRILLQVESRGEAWYINPNDGKRYFLGDPKTAYNAMRFLSLGIKNDDLRKIEVGEFE